MRTAEDAEAIRLEVVRLLTQVARDGQKPGHVDIAEFLASALVSVAANVGGVDLMLAGRPGSWEAGLVSPLVEGMVGGDAAYLMSCRTEEVVLHLDVHRTVWGAEPSPHVPLTRRTSTRCEPSYRSA